MIENFSNSIARAIAAGTADGLQDAMDLCKWYEKEGYYEVDGLPFYDLENLQGAHSFGKDIRNGCVRLLKDPKSDAEAEIADKVYWESMKFDGPYDFDCFMRYIERNRMPSARYWQPRRAKLLPIAKALQDMEDGKLDELFLSMPPRTGKTTLMVFFMLWVMLRDPERSNLYCSYTDAVVNVFYNGIIEILNDPVTYLWKDVFPDRRLASTNAKDLLINIDRRKRYASFTGRSLYGTLNGACDCNGYEIADDLISGIEEAMNKDRLNNAWLKVDNNYLPRAKEGARRLWIGTRWSLTDPQQRRMDLLEGDPRFKNIRWKAVNVPALNKHDVSNFDYEYGVGFSTQYFKQRRASFEQNNDMASWLAQYQGEPVERSGALFEPDDLRYYNSHLPEIFEPDRIFMCVDPAWGGGDYTAAPVICQFENDLYMVDCVFSNGDKTVTIPRIASLVEKYKVASVIIEGTRTTKSYGEELSRLLESKKCRTNIQTNVKNWAGNGKVQRIFDKAPDIREHIIFLERKYQPKEYHLFMNNLFSFTMEGKNKHDDAPDSLCMVVQNAFFFTPKIEIRRRPF